MSETRVPAIPAVTSSNLTDVAKAIKQVLDVREGVVGDPLDANVTFRDLADAGLAQIPTVRLGVRGSIPIVPVGAGSDGYDPATDRIPPPAPENFSATGAFAAVILQWDAPQYRNHAYTEIWRSASNLLSQAVLIGTTTTRFYTDNLGTSTTAYYWGRHVSLANVSGAYSSLLGTVATTATDPGLVLESLTGQITESQLYSDLAQRIDLIDGPATLTGSVAARLASEASARSAAIQAEADARTAAIDFEAQARADAILGEATARTSAITTAAGSLQTQIDLLSAASAGDVGELIAVVKAEETSRVTADEAFARTSAALFAINADNAAAIKTEETVRSTADSSQASSLTVLYATTGDAKAAVLAESNVRAAGDTSTASQLSGLSAISSANSAGLALEREVSASQSSAIASQALALTAIAGDSRAALQVEQQARSDADTASASQALSLAAAVQDSRSSLQVEQSLRSTADLSIASQVTTIAASSGGNTAGLQVEQNVRANQDSSLSSQVSSFSAISGANSAALAIEQQVSIDRDLAVASQVSGFTSTLGSTVSSLRVEQETRSNQDSALSSQITRALAKTDDGAAALLVEQIARVTADQATASFSSSLSSTFGNSNSALAVEQFTRAGADSASAGLVSNLNSAVGSSGAALRTEELARSSQSSALSSQLINLTAATGANAAAIRQESQVSTDENEAVARRVDTLQLTTNGNTTAIQAEAQVRATETGSLFAKYGVKVDLAGHVSGFGLLSTLNTATPTSSFGVRADQFFIAPPSVASPAAPTENLYDGFVWLDTSVTPNVTRYRQASNWVTTSPRLPFVVQSTPTTINGVSVPAGVYIDTAFIRDGTITNAKIGNLAVDNAKIANLNATKITAGFLSVDRIEAGSITAAKIAANTITAAEIAANTITAGQIAANTITADKIAANTITAAQIGANAITADRINGANLTITAAGVELGNDVGPGTGHYGLSLSDENFNNIFIRRHDGVVFFRVNDGGTNSLTFDSSTGVLNVKGVLSASQVAVGTASGATTFFDPAQPGIPLNSSASGFLAFSGGTASASTVQATCEDGKGGTYNCSYTVLTPTWITAESLTFRTSDPSIPIERRIRTGPVRFSVTAAGTVDHFLSIWYRVTNASGAFGNWVPIAMATEPQRDYGGASVSANLTINIALGRVIQFAFAALNTSGQYWNANLNSIVDGTISVTGVNF